MLADPLEGLSDGVAQRSSAAGLELREPREVEAARRTALDELAGLTLTVDHTPGHTRGRWCSAGDRGRPPVSCWPATPCSPGRSGAPTCPVATTSRCWRRCATSLLSRATTRRCCPATGRSTTIGQERAANPFLQDSAPRARARGLVRRLVRRGLVPAFCRAQGRPRVRPAGRRPSSSRVRDTLLARGRPRRLRHIELPVFEDTALFARGVGESTDVVQQGDVHLRRPRRPLGDAAARGHRGRDAGGDRARPGPRPAAGQAVLRRAVLPLRAPAGRAATGSCSRSGIEAIGVDDPALDAEVIAVADEGFRALGLSGFRLDITSLGDDDLPARSTGSCSARSWPASTWTRRPGARARLNPLRVLDDKRPRGAGDARGRPADDRPPVRRLPRRTSTQVLGAAGRARRRRTW